MQVDEEVYLYVTSHFGDWMKTTTSLVLAKNQRSAYLSNEALLTELVMVLAIAALLAWIAAYFVSSSIAKPLSELIRIAQNISKGTYITTFPSANAREVETLSTAISDMQDGIKEREKAIHQLAFFDELTGLPNRLQFIQSINDHIAEKPASGLIVLTLDVDRFKEINDTVGHEIGDELLQLIAQRLQTYTDHLAFFARLSGDEFGLVVDSNDEAVAEHLAQNVVGLFERPFSINDLVLGSQFSLRMLKLSRGSFSVQILLCIAVKISTIITQCTKQNSINIQ
jgi:GGDEF domain-containing protein